MPGKLKSDITAIMAINKEGIIYQFNEGAEILLGYSATDLIGKKKTNFFLVKEEYQKFQEDIAARYKIKDASFDAYEVLAENNDYDAREWTVTRKDGSTFIAHSTLTPLKTDSGECIGFMRILKNVDHQKIIEKNLLLKNEILNEAEKLTKMGHWQWNTVINHVTWSRNLFDVVEIEPRENLDFDFYFSFVHPDDKEIVSASFDKSINDKKFYDLLHRIVTAKGKTKTIQLLGEVISDESGNVVELIGTCQDVTQQRMAEIKFKGLLESAPDAMVIVNDKEIIQLVNKQAVKLFGYSSEELIGKKVDLLIPDKYKPEKVKDLDEFFNKAMPRKMNNDKEVYGLHKNGKEIPLQINLSPLKTEDGILVYAAIRDITLQKKIETDLLRKNHILNKAEQLTSIGSWIWNTVNSDVTFSNNLYRIFEIDRSEVLNFDSYLNCVHPEDKEMVDVSIAKSIEDNLFHDLLHRIVTTNGVTKMVQIFGEVISDNDGQVIEFMGTCQDVTQQRMAEIKFRGLLESAPDAMVIVNDDGNIQLINKQAEKLFGYSPEELFNKAVDILIPDTYSFKNNEHRKMLYNTPKTRKMGDGRELYGINKKGKKIPIQISLSPLKTEEGLLLSAAIRDITIQKKAEKKILEAKEGLEILANKLTFQNTQLADFAHITSHNLRAPVSNLNTLIEFYKTSATEEERGILFDKIEIVINHLTDTLNTLIQALKTKSETTVEIETLEFSEFLNKTKEILTGQILDTEAKITGDFKKYPNINYNRVYLESIFLNLLSNSIKYKSDVRKPEISVQSVVEDGLLKLKFKDNGLGINLDRHGSKIFGLNKVFHRHPDAKGVGLFMTKVQIESMGGEITVESEVNVGTTFSINFNEGI
ncbi:PAS domain S-box protein [Aurantibacter sp.]|uniref:PAS domain-containing sensor histidine kinase n=1 Tax=Aurantibacter sp. TaxID=2807103 RepID=UPI00326592A8